MQNGRERLVIIEVMLCQSFLERLDQANQINRLAGEQAGDNGDRLVRLR